MRQTTTTTTPVFTPETLKRSSAKRAPALGGPTHAPDGVPPRAAEDDAALERWTRALRSLELRADDDADTARAWIRGRHLAAALRAAAARDRQARSHTDALAALHDSVQALLSQLASRLEPALVADLAAWLELQSERTQLEQARASATEDVRKAFEERQHRQVREWFAQSVPVRVLAGLPVPTIDSEAHAEAALTSSLAALAGARAACVARPSRHAQQALGDYGGRRSREGGASLPAEPPQIDRAAEEAERTLAQLPSAGPEPSMTRAREVRILNGWVQYAWGASAFGALLSGAVLVLALAMRHSIAEELSFMSALAWISWVLAGGGLAVWKIADVVLRRRYAAWRSRSVPRMAAYRALAWQYVVRRAAVEQHEAEAAALRAYLDAAAALRTFDADLARGAALTAVRGRHPGLAREIETGAFESDSATEGQLDG